MKKIRWLLLIPMLLGIANATSGFSTHGTRISRVFNPMETPVGGLVTVTVRMVNSSSHDMRGFYYTEHMPAGLAVNTKSLTINGSPVSNYKIESGKDGDIDAGYVPFRWILETPPLLTENNPLPAGAELQMIYTISAALAGTYVFEAFNWAGSFPDLLAEYQAAFGYSEVNDIRTIRFIAAGIVAADDNYMLQEKGAITRPPPGILENDTGAGNPLTAMLVTDVKNGTLDLNQDGSFTYTHDGGETSSDNFTYHAADGSGISNPAVVTFTITPVNDMPFAGDDIAQTLMNRPATIPVSGNDGDADGHVDPASITIKEAPSHGKAQSNADGSVTYTPDIDFADTDTFTYTLRDNQGALSNVAVVTVVVSRSDDGGKKSSGGGCFVAVVCLPAPGR